MYTKEGQTIKLLDSLKSLRFSEFDRCWWIEDSHWKLWYSRYYNQLVFFNEFKTINTKLLNDVWDDLPDNFKTEIAYHLDIL
jgi:hypothetical protein